MKKYLTLAAVSLSFSVFLTSVSFANTAAGSISIKDKKEKDYPGLATITLQEAVEAALSAVPGKAVEAELDDEKGFLVYDVKVITADNRKHEITVDAGNKAILKSKAK